MTNLAPESRERYRAQAHGDRQGLWHRPSPTRPSSALAPPEAAWRKLHEAEQAAAAIPARTRLGDITPDMARLETEVKQITHAIRMAAYNAETTVARALQDHYTRAADEAYTLIREALTTSGDIIPAGGELLIRLDPLIAPRRTRALAALCHSTFAGSVLTSHFGWHNRRQDRSD
jgi:hypothetical protein